MFKNKLEPIAKEHVIQAAQKIDNEGVPTNRQWSQFWVQVNEEEYQFKYITQLAYQVATGEKVEHDFFPSNESYRNYVRKLGFPVIYKSPDEVITEEFFSRKDINFFSQYGGQDYDKENREHQEVGQRIKRSIFDKTNIWANALNIEGWKVEGDHHWHHWNKGAFKDYSWARIYKEGDADKKIFFTVGVDAPEKALVYKLDCKHSGEGSLSDEQVEIFKSVVHGTEARWKQVSLEGLSKYNWERLINETKTFINKYEYLYDEAISAVWEGEVRNTLRRKQASQKKNQSSGSNNDFQGYDTDWKAKNERASEIGNKGEELVVKYEKQNLREENKEGLAEKVHQVKEDGKGYDVLSFYTDGSKKFIEVKTTVGEQNTPFEITIREVDFSKKYPEQYHLYRIYNLDERLNLGDFTEYKGSIEDHFELDPVSYEAKEEHN